MISSLTAFVRYSEILSDKNNTSLSFLEVDASQQKEIAALIKKNQGVLLTEWVSPNKKKHAIQWSVLYLVPEQGLYCVQSHLPKKHLTLIDLSLEFPVCNRLQRTLYELTRIPTKGAKDKRPWLNHGHFPIGILNEDALLKPLPKPHFSFQKVSGKGVHEIPVGPVHAGIIEPGHFRFSVVGERILKLEERLGYTHKGIHQLLQNKSIEEARKLISRVSGDSTVAYSIAFAKACERVLSYKITQRTVIERAICLERERLGNHVGDIGAIINDTGLPSLQAFFNCLKEQLLRHNAQYLGHRYFMDCIKPCSETSFFSSSHLQLMKTELQILEKSLVSLQKRVETHFGLQDRLCGTGTISKDQAIHLGLLGVASKAAGVDRDLRRLFPDTEYEARTITESTLCSGDVMARVAVRFKESFESIQLILASLLALQSFTDSPLETEPHSSSTSAPHPVQQAQIPQGIGVVEGWRGPITVVLSIDQQKIEWCHFHDPSWQNWLAVEYAVMGNIVADFPLINKSFNLSYSGHDS